VSSLFTYSPMVNATKHLSVIGSNTTHTLSIPVAVTSKAHVCSRLIVAIAGSNLDAGMEVRLMCWVGSDLCDKLITGAEESCRVCVSNCSSIFFPRKMSAFLNTYGFDVLC
jgi:hypothetical protein